MLKLIVQCPKCKNVQNYIHYKLNFKWEIYEKRTLCRRCNKPFTIKGPRSDNIVREGW